MSSSAPLLSVLVTVAALLSGCAKPPTARKAPQEAGPTIAAIVAEYQTYRQMTDNDVYVNPELAMLCIGASQFHVDNARKTKGPHAHSAIRVLMNPSAAQSFSSGGHAYAPGAVIVKQKRFLSTRDGKSTARDRTVHNGVGGMVKRAPGFDPANGDWEYFYFDDASTIESGRILSCIECHKTAKPTDYVFGDWAAHPASRVGR
ncbi:MAG: cytochrome P460 family protein [Verrucomicrobiota bacterium]